MLIYTFTYNNKIIYIGSTIQNIKQRMMEHKYSLKKRAKNLLHRFIKDNNLTFDDIIVETYPQDFPIIISPGGKKISPRLRICEGIWQKILMDEGVDLKQKEIAGRTTKSFKKTEKHRQNIIKYHKSEKYKDNQKKYYEKNKKKRDEYFKQYYIKNRDSILKKRKNKNN